MKKNEKIKKILSYPAHRLALPAKFSGQRTVVPTGDCVGGEDF
jgi:hypothetical protein